MFIFSILLIKTRVFCFDSRYYVYYRQITSKQSFNDLVLRELLTEAHVSSQRVGGVIAMIRDAPFVGPKDLNSWVREEFKLIILFINKIVKCGLT